MLLLMIKSVLVLLSVAILALSAAINGDWMGPVRRG